MEVNEESHNRAAGIIPVNELKTSIGPLDASISQCNAADKSQVEFI
jgi:hypothetical protein